MEGRQQGNVKVRLKQSIKSSWETLYCWCQLRPCELIFNITVVTIVLAGGNSQI